MITDCEHQRLEKLIGLPELWVCIRCGQKYRNWGVGNKLVLASVENTVHSSAYREGLNGEPGRFEIGVIIEDGKQEGGKNRFGSLSAKKQFEYERLKVLGAHHMTLQEAVKHEEETYQRLKDEIEEGRQNEADYWRFLDGE